MDRKKEGHKAVKARLIHSRTSSVFVAVLFLSSLPGTSAWAQSGDSDDAKAKALFRQAQTAYDLAEFDKALSLYSEAYKTKPLPGFLFNLGQCHRQTGNYERAAFFFQRFIDNSAPKAPNVELARQLVDDMRKKVAEKAAAPTPAVPTASPAPAKTQGDDLKRFESEPSPTATAPTATPTPSVAPSASAVASQGLPTEATQVEEASVPVTQRWWFWAAIGVGAAVAAGVAVGLVVGGGAQKNVPNYDTVSWRNAQ